jgi:hypothetical protein
VRRVAGRRIRRGRTARGARGGFEQRLGLDERAGRVEHLLAVAAAYESAVQRQVILLQAEDGFTMRTAGREEHG